MPQRPLFGGAIVAELPIDIIDASDIRQVPDSQEVFLYKEGACLVVEVLERVADSDDTNAVKFHFEALADDNDAIVSTMQDPLVIPNDRGDRTPSPIVLHGTQKICKFNQTAVDQVEVLLALFRVQTQQKSADVVVSANIPKSSGGQVIVAEEKAAAIALDFRLLVSSLCIVNYGLFA
ncbi:Mog1p/PsbP-like protein [Paxillus ammoniavirescens]|nr:Mog1p/PsbP-like protein [Paxillus ammoniavirescens]